MEGVGREGKGGREGGREGEKNFSPELNLKLKYPVKTDHYCSVFYFLSASCWIIVSELINS